MINKFLLEIFVNSQLLVMSKATELSNKEEIGFFHRHTLNLLKKIMGFNEDFESVTTLSEFWSLFGQWLLNDVTSWFWLTFGGIIMTGLGLWYSLTYGWMSGNND